VRCQKFLGASILFLFLPIAAGSEELHADNAWLSEDLMVEQIGTNIWRHVSYRELERFGRSAANGLIVVSEGTAALIDTPWTDALTAELFEWVSRSLGARVKTVVVTHSHPDCLGGLEAAHEREAISYSSASTASFARRDGKAAPENTFTESMTVVVGSRELQLHFAGPGHTSDNIVVWIPDDSILFGGCLVRSGSSTHLGYTDEADLVNWSRTIDSLRKRYEALRLVVPGHGTPGGAELLDRTLELLKHN
jgi:metallo-beta-lactamase class B